MTSKQTEDKIRKVLHKTDGVFQIAAVHGYKWEGTRL